MTGRLANPVFRDGCASEELYEEIAEQISEDEEHDGPSSIFELLVDAEKPEIKEKDGHLVSKQTD